MQGLKARSDPTLLICEVGGRLVEKTIGRKNNWSKKQLVENTIGRKYHWSKKQLVENPIGRKYHWSKIRLVKNTIGQILQEILKFPQLE